VRTKLPNPDGSAGAIANEVLPKASQDRGRMWRRAHHTRPAQVLSRRSLAGALRRGFVSRLRAEAPPRAPPGRPSVYHRPCHTSVTNYADATGPQSPDLLQRAHRGLAWTPIDGLYNLCHVVPHTKPRDRKDPDHTRTNRAATPTSYTITAVQGPASAVPPADEEHPLFLQPSETWVLLELKSGAWKELYPFRHPQGAAAVRDRSARDHAPVGSTQAGSVTNAAIRA
jgi:hypothetical protein